MRAQLLGPDVVIRCLWRRKATPGSRIAHRLQYHRRVSERLREIASLAGTTVDDVLGFLDSPDGRRLRRRVATGLIVSVPIVMRVPGLRRTAVGRAIELAGGATIVVKLAELIRDWERERAEAEAEGAASS